MLSKHFLESCILMRPAPQKCHLFYCKYYPLEIAKNEVRAEACKGDPMRKFIMECRSKCGCNKQYGNWVVYLGIT